MPESAPRPDAPKDLFRAFNRMALQGFGGVLPVAQRELVERLRWLTREQFLELLALSQVLPGPNVVNLSLILGDRYFGLRGGLAAVAGMLLAPLAIILFIAAAAANLDQVPSVVGALRGMGIVAAGLVLSTAIKLAPGLRRNRLGLGATVAFTVMTALAVGVLRWPLPAVVLGLGLMAVGLSWQRGVP